MQGLMRFGRPQGSPLLWTGSTFHCGAFWGHLDGVDAGECVQLGDYFSDGPFAGSLADKFDDFTLRFRLYAEFLYGETITRADFVNSGDELACYGGHV